MSNLNTFVNNLSGGGARANQFKATIYGQGIPEQKMQFMCRSAQVPAMTVGEVAVPYRGRQVFVAGDRTYDAWTVTVFSDQAWQLRRAFENWSHSIANMQQEVTGALNPTTYYAIGEVHQLGRDGESVAEYFLADLWPQTVDAIDLAYDTNDAVMEFGVTLRFNYMVISK
tara:strand:- start:77 stop:586 length:510 start_codon:yes stop_codon:yes gene_type:complete